MTQLVFLSKHEKRQFDSPPVFTKLQRPAYFAVTDDIRKTMGSLRTPTNKVGFLLQLGYFKHSGKFFEKSAFRSRDIKYLKQLLNITAAVDLAEYLPSRMTHHQSRILKLLGWTFFNADSASLIAEHVQLQTQQQIKPEQIFSAAVDFCWQQRIEVPSHHQLADVITESFNIVESALLNQLENSLQPPACDSLDALLSDPGGLIPPLTEIKSVNQSLRASDIQKNVDACWTYAHCFTQLESCYAQLSISENATEYYATWVKKATLGQLNQFPNRWKRYLHLLAFIKHEYFIRQDVLMGTLLNTTRSAVNASRRQEDRTDLQKRSEQRNAIRTINKAQKTARHLLKEITCIVRSEEIEPSERLARVEQLLCDYEALQGAPEQEKLTRCEQLLDRQTDDQRTYDGLEKQSVRLQRKTSSILKALVFDKSSSESPIFEAVAHFQVTDGHVGQRPPVDFMPTKEQEIFVEGEPFRTSLYKILLFQAVATAVRAGKLNLRHSYRYRAIQDYLIPMERWTAERERLLSLASLEKFADATVCLDDLKAALDTCYQRVNQRYHSGENEHLSVDEKGYVKVRTPAMPYSEEGYVGQVLTEHGIIPVLHILRQVHQDNPFTACFKHLSPKHHKLTPSTETILAGILGKGCNIGIEKLSQISLGLNESTLKNTVKWCFTLKNIQTANALLLNAMDKLALSNAFQEHADQLHTSSDGRKVNVAVDSLHASYSFKYFGKDKGVTLYTFIDERHALFHSTVISASEREAAYVIDGLMQNEVVKSDIHSTDTHGFTEAIFAATHLIDTAFAPRIKKMGKQRLYGFSSKTTHQRRGDVIVPSRTINRKLIVKHWDDILRFMATIKLRHSSASQLFKRLSSYASDHPLYKALKEFGRLIKTQFILTYYDDLELRQRIEKQLNKVELSNRFSKAVFFANNQEFQNGSRDEQEISTACMVLIQNAIVLWNTLYLSQRLSSASNAEEQQQMLNAITSSSLLTWRHVNLQGEYDFRQIAANDEPFNMKKILALRLS
jgi:TnpA family transposase